MDIIEFKASEIKLKDLLKATNLIPSGGLAKLVIREEGVLLNDKPCYIAGKKIYPEDEVIFDGVKIVII
ncbi:RNA-binding S4 domain-containing protein [uncultured Anaerococcus sp.]|uniref:RNA-binding S4 domain-containing protein n=1 Tax=uncultured Anaerococcus sp. TaxID=293428 RepID=UPI0025FE8BED|nr:RNA-binding S4 domain-containing protein [uncultured Anaerococcus sp.]